MRYLTMSHCYAFCSMTTGGGMILIILYMVKELQNFAMLQKTAALNWMIQIYSKDRLMISGL